jgi:hypothetical protein
MTKRLGVAAAADFVGEAAPYFRPRVDRAAYNPKGAADIHGDASS